MGKVVFVVEHSEISVEDYQVVASIAKEASKDDKMFYDVARKNYAGNRQSVFPIDKPWVASKLEEFLKLKRIRYEKIG